MAMNRFAYGRATSIAEAIEVLDDQCRPLAGGTDLLAMIKEDLVAPIKLVELKRIPGVDQVWEEAGTLHIGALCRLSDLLNHPTVSGLPAWTCLYRALLRTASPQVRHMATLGGNLMQRPRCWYYRNARTHCLRKGGQRCFAFRGENKYHAILGGGPCYIVHPSDPAVALLALDASVVVAGPGSTRTVPISDFYLLPRQDAHNETALAANELITEVIVPAPTPGALGTYLKSAERQAWDFALVSAAVQIAFDGEIVQVARVSLGGVAPVPWRSTAAEEALAGQPLTEATIEQAAQAATAGARPLAQNEFKVDLAQGLVRQALRDLAP